MILRLLLAVLALVVLPGVAEASRMPAPPRATVIEGPCPYYDGGEPCADIAASTVYVPWGDRYALQHELGHLFDAQVLTDPQRAWFTRLFRMTGAWDQGTGEGTRGPSEVFADAYATCARGWSPRGRRGRNGLTWVRWTTAYDYRPSVRRHQRACNAIAFLGLVAQQQHS